MATKRLVMVLISVSILLSVPTPSLAADRIALVIGNRDYHNSPLRNPVHDADDIAVALQNLGFTVTKKLNVNQQEMEHAIREFGRNIKVNDTALFYFSGHGAQVNGVNYLLPLGTDFADEDELKYKAVAADMVLDKLKRAGSRFNIVILDACRNNPFRFYRSTAARGLAPMVATYGTIIAYATAPGTVAYDGHGRNSPYTTFLLKAMQTPGLKLEEVFKQVRARVLADTNHQQIPWETSSVVGDFYFRPARNDGTYASNRQARRDSDKTVGQQSNERLQVIVLEESSVYTEDGTPFIPEGVLPPNVP